MSHHVLLVDDSPTTRAYVAAALEAQGDLSVTEARSGFEAMKILPQGQFDLVVTDINMPEINGLEVIRFTRRHERYRDTPVLIISTEGRDVDRDKALRLGANEYLVKPFSPEELVAVVRRLLGEADA